ncbi:hypothetical protein [Streptomyces massasporeus]|uniref:hypothetical protein n=1 Tax=Streptomyces massasporeus TaxID=67324 RepID=UPI00370320FC
MFPHFMTRVVGEAIKTLVELSVPGVVEEQARAYGHAVADVVTGASVAGMADSSMLSDCEAQAIAANSSEQLTDLFLELGPPSDEIKFGG